MSDQQPVVNDFDSLRTGAQQLTMLAQLLGQTGQRFKQIHQELKAHCGGDESGIGKAVTDTTSDTAAAAGDVFDQAGRVGKQMGLRLHGNADRSEAMENGIADSFNSSGRTDAGSAPEDPNGGSDPSAGADSEVGPGGRFYGVLGGGPGGLRPNDGSTRPYGPDGLVHDDPCEVWLRTVLNARLHPILL